MNTTVVLIIAIGMLAIWNWSLTCRVRRQELFWEQQDEAMDKLFQNLRTAQLKDIKWGNDGNHIELDLTHLFANTGFRRIATLQVTRKVDQDDND